MKLSEAKGSSKFSVPWTKSDRSSLSNQNNNNNNNQKLKANSEQIHANTLMQSIHRYTQM